MREPANWRVTTVKGKQSGKRELRTCHTLQFEFCSILKQRWHLKKRFHLC